MKINIKRYEIAVDGIFGRNRSVKSAYVTLRDVPESDPQPSVAELRPLFDAKLAEIKLKKGRARLRVIPVEQDGPIEILALSMLIAPPILHEVTR